MSSDRGNEGLSGRVGINTFGFFIQINGSNLLPLIYVDNCAEAIVLAGLKPGIDSEVFNVVDDELLTGREFLKACKNDEAFSLSPGSIFACIWSVLSLGKTFELVKRPAAPCF